MMKMRYWFLFLIVILTILLISSNANATTCINLKLAKSSYLPYETVQLEIDADVSQEIRESDIFLTRQETALPTKFFISKISITKYFVWFDLPSSSGDYIVKVRGNCKDGSFYVASLPLKVDSTIASAYAELKTSVKDKFSSLNLEEHLLSAIALIDDEISEQALARYIERSDSCLNKNCSTKFNALTLMAFKDSLLRQKIHDSLEASQNNVVKGSWKLQITSTIAQECMLLFNNQSSSLMLNSGTNEMDLDFTNFSNINAASIILKVSCDNEVTSKLIYKYKQFVKEFNLTNSQTGSQILLNNNGCFVSSFDKVFNEDCDNDATSYSLLALARTNKFDPNSHSSAVSWLSNNAKTTIDKAIVYYINHDSATLDELLSSQTISGWWSKALGEYQANVEASSIVTLALKGYITDETSTPLLNSITKAEKWLLNKTKTSSLKEKATILAFAFDLKDAEPLLEFWPGVIKTQSLGSFDLILQNKGSKEITVNAILLNSTTSIDLVPNEMKNLKFNVPLITTVDGRTLLENLVLNYHTKISEKNFYYSVPVLIFTQKAAQEQVNGSINTSEQKINQSEQQEIINETKELENKTAEINQSLLQLFRFIERGILKNVSANEPFTVTVRLSNQLDKEVNDITITYSSSLILMGGTIKIEPSFIETMTKGETKTITIYFTPAISGNHTGSIIVTAKYNDQDITTNLPVNIKVASSITEEKNCTELGGKVCEKADEFCEVNLTTTKDSYYCCIPAESCKKKPTVGKTTGIIIIVIVVIFLLIILILLRKKPKKEMEEFLKETSKAYEKRFQRPPSIVRT